MLKELAGFKGYFANRQGEIFRQSRNGLVKLNPSPRWKNKGSRYKHLRVWLEGQRKDVHRLIFETFHGPIPKGAVVRHRDDNAENNAPDNLVLGTPRDNVHDSIRNGTFARGEKSGQSVLKEVEVIEILKLKHLPVSALMARYNVSETTIRNILNNKTWKHIKREEEII
jgi:hypothetical protein